MIGFEHGTLALQASILTIVPREYLLVVQRKPAVKVCCQAAGVCSVLATAKLPHFLSTLLQSMALEFNPFRLVLTLNEFRS